MVIILWIMFGLIGFGLYGLILAFLIELGGGSVYWPWEDKTEGAGNNVSQQESELLECEGQLLECKINNVIPESGSGLVNDAENRAVQAGIFAGAVLIRAYRDDQRAVDRLTKGLDLAKESESTDNVKRSEQALEDGRKRRDITFEIYVDQLRKSAEYSMQENREQLDDLKKQLRQRKDMKPFERFAEVFVSQIESYKKDHTADEGKLAGQILE